MTIIFQKMSVRFSTSPVQAFTIGSVTKLSMGMLSLLRIHYKVDHTFSLLIKLMNSSLLSVTLPR
jgi:hypothetical protein